MRIFVMYAAKRAWLLFTILWLFGIVVDALPGFKPFSGGQSNSVKPMKNAAVVEEELELADKVTDGVIAATTLVYGLTMVAYAHFFPLQIHVITMMRATGFEKIEKGIAAARQNFRQAIRTAVFNAPSLLLMTKSLKDLGRRLDSATAVKAETRKAMEDGVIDRREARKIEKMKNRQIRAVKRDMRRLKRGASSLGRVIQALDFDELQDLSKNFMFIMTTVLASGSSDSFVGKVISRYCHWLNLASLVLDVNRKIGFPLSRLIVLRDLDIFDDDLEPEERDKMRNTATAIMYSVSAYMIIFKNDLGEQLNDSLVASAITARGLSAITGVTEMAVSNKAGFGLEERNAELHLELKRLGGCIMLFLTAISLRCASLAKDGILKLPPWLKPLVKVEVGLDRLVAIVRG